MYMGKFPDAACSLKRNPAWMYVSKEKPTKHLAKNGHFYEL
jgi:hypothetical protein